MSLEKITTQQMDAKGVCAAPDVLSGTPAQNKAVFDRMVRELIAPAYNAAVDAVNALEETESGIEAAEALRVAAEELRAAAETARAEAESGRAEAEQQRQDAETQRQDLESGYVARSENGAKASESWAVGGTGTREGEDTNNAKYWSEQAAAAAGGGVTSFKGRTGSVIPASGDYTAEMVGAYSKEETDTLLQNKADLGADGKVPAGQVDAYSQSDSISAETRTALSLAETATPDAALAEIARQLSESGGVTIDLLWENASPTSAFAAQSITVDNVSDYQLFMIESNNYLTNMNMYYDFIFFGKRGYLLNIGYSTSWDPASLCIERSLESTNTGFTIGDSTINGGSTDGKHSIPTRIFGIKGITMAT